MTRQPSANNILSVCLTAEIVSVKLESAPLAHCLANVAGQERREQQDVNNGTDKRRCQRNQSTQVCGQDIGISFHAEVLRDQEAEVLAQGVCAHTFRGEVRTATTHEARRNVLQDLLVFGGPGVVGCSAFAGKRML